MKLKIKLLENSVGKPEYAHADDAGLDLMSAENGMLAPSERRLVRTGIAVQIPKGMVGLICSRSGLARKEGVFVLNAPGVIDCGYTGELCVILKNGGKGLYQFSRGDRIAQLLIQECRHADALEVVDSFSETSERGAGGFGSTGV